ncbi:MAG TPA: cupin domain-containing protein, partial [Kaistia sp.]|nr:cupin domain-containing protein [Kaistia sp.]
MDPLSDVLSLMRPRNHMSAGFDAGGDWSIQFPDQRESIKCGAIVSGSCWLSVDGVADPARLEAGDSFLLPSGRPFRLSSDLALAPVGAASVFAHVPEGGIVTHQGGGDCLLVSSRFALAGNYASMLLGVLPPIVHLRKETDPATLRWSVERMMQELRDPQPGGFLVVQHLAHMILVQAL